MSKLIVFDGNNILLRAMFAPVNEEMVYEGVNTGVLYRCMNMLFKKIRQFQPTHFVITFDHGRSEYRLNRYPEYKANRDDDANDPERIARKELYLTELQRWQDELDELYLTYISKKKVEADDIIASITEHYPGQKLVITSDHDLRQLVSQSVRIHAPAQNRKSSDMTYDLGLIRERYGCAPDDLPKIWALMGDKGDNIIGLPRVGEKTARAKLEEFQFDFASAADALAKTPEDKERVHLNLDMIRLHPELFTGLPRYDSLALDYELLRGDVRRMSERWGFQSFINRLDRLF